MSDVPAKRGPVAVQAASVIVPQAIANLGDDAAWRFIEFFTARVENDNTRAAYLRATRRFFEWLGRHALELKEVRPPHVAAYLKELGDKDGLSRPTVKQHLAALRMLFDYLVIGQVIPFNPTTSVQGPKHKRGPNESAQRGKTPVLSGEDARTLLNAIDVSSVVGLRDRALIALMIYSFARVGAALAMNVRDYYQNGKRWYVRLHEKGGKDHEMPAHHTLEEYLDAYLEAAGIAQDHAGPLFRTAKGKTKTLTGNRMSRYDAHSMIRRRALDAGITAPIGNHTFRATGITNYLENGGTLEKAQEMAAHESAKTTKLYDRRQANVTLDEVQQRDFRIEYRGNQGFELEFDQARALVGITHIIDLFKVVSFHGLSEWQYSRDTDIRSAFGPLNRILSAIDSTPSYQLFLAGFQVAERIGFLEQETFEEMAILASFRGLLGPVRWKEGKKGRLFFLPEGYVPENHVRRELLGNGKLLWITLWSGGGHARREAGRAVRDTHRLQYVGIDRHRRRLASDHTTRESQLRDRLP